MTQILDGKKLSQSLAIKLAKKISRLKSKPKIIIIQIGNLEETNTYIKNKISFANKIGVLSEHKRYPNNVKGAEIISDIHRYNKNPSVHGIMVQLPGPKNFNIDMVTNSIDPKKDVDGLTASSIKHLFDNKKGFVPATTKGIISILDKYKIGLLGKKVVMVGQSSLVGRPTTLALLNKGATVTVCHKDTKNLNRETKQADILITATGQPKLITKKHVSKNQIVIDIGISVTKDKKVLGDVDFKNVKGVVKAITPVPGGVGPMTVVSLFENLLEGYSSQT